jgi:hypothetical protein
VTRVFFAILKEIYTMDKRGNSTSNVYPTCLKDGTFVVYDNREFIEGVLSRVETELLKKEKFWRGFTMKEIKMAVAKGINGKIRELKNMTIRT